MTDAYFELGASAASSDCILASKPNILIRYLKSLSKDAAPEVYSTSFEDLKRSFLEPIFSESFLVLVGALKNEDQDEHDTEVVFQLLSALIFEGDHLVNLLNEFCGSKPSEEARLCGDQLVLLPDTTASSSRNERKQFTEKSFYSRLAGVIVEVLHIAAHSPSRHDFTTLGKILGRVCKRSHGPSYVMPVLTSYVIRLKRDDYRSRKFVWQLFSAVSNDYLDSVVIAVLNYCPNWKLVSSFLGDIAVERDVCRNLFLDKFVNVKYFDKNQFVCNLIGYLAGPETTRQGLLNEICGSLISLWKDLFVIQYCPFAQLLYINKCVVLAVSCHPNPADLIVFNADVLQGITNYLKSSFENVKFLGAYVGQILCNKINAKTAVKKLDLSCNESAKDENDIANDIECMISQFEKQELEDLAVPNNINVKIDEAKSSAEEVTGKNDSIPSRVTVLTDFNHSDTDSDDDLVPYDMSNDVARPNFVKSFYLQDILSNLMSEEASKNPELFEETIMDAEKIIQRAEDSAVSELCVEVAKLLLHIEDKYSTSGFEGYRVGALTALLTRQPEKMSSYLIQQFYTSDYSIRHRLDILQTIRSGVLKLSSVDGQSTASVNCEPVEAGDNRQIPEWRKIVDARVRSKTKFYKSANVKREAPVSNKFAAVCGFFFFPFLAEFDKPMRTLQLQNEDSHVFSNLLYTLGIVVYNAANSPLLDKMVKTLLGEFCTGFIQHSDAAVRQSVWFCAVLSALALKPINVTSDDDLLKVLLSFRLFAVQVQSNDSHTECVDLARHFISCLNNLINNTCGT